MCVFGEWLRKSAMCTAGAAFTHLIQTRRRATHVLVTEGAYAYARHPGYLGWFIWALGTQLVLGNVASVAAFAVVTWVYFKRRITYEERHLRNMFSEYDAYAKRVRTWIPGIK
jgi:protein-S-isoprenylcysteine O-methyltransferase